MNLNAQSLTTSALQVLFLLLITEFEHINRKNEFPSLWRVPKTLANRGLQVEQNQRPQFTLTRVQETDFWRWQPFSQKASRKEHSNKVWSTRYRLWGDMLYQLHRRFVQGEFTQEVARRFTNLRSVHGAISSRPPLLSRGRGAARVSARGLGRALRGCQQS